MGRGLQQHSLISFNGERGTGPVGYRESVSAQGPGLREVTSDLT